MHGLSLDEANVVRLARVGGELEVRLGDLRADDDRRHDQHCCPGRGCGSPSLFAHGSEYINPPQATARALLR